MSAKLAWSAAGILAVGHGELLDLWQIGDRIRPVALAVRPPIGGAVAALAFDAPGERLAVAIARDPAAVEIRSLAAARRQLVRQHLLEGVPALVEDGMTIVSQM